MSCFHDWTPCAKSEHVCFLMFFCRVVQDFLVKVVQGEVKGHLGTQDILGLKEKKATLDSEDHLVLKETRWVLWTFLF